MEKKIVFILASDANTNNIKRIEEFVEHGYQVEVYSFKRRETSNATNKAKINIIGTISNDLPYLNRLRIIRKGIKTVLWKTKQEKCVYYLIRNDVAIFFYLMSRKDFIFEEADMTHVNFKNSLVRTIFEALIKRIIKKSKASVFRSEGFVRYHFRNASVPANVFVIPNKLHKKALGFPVCQEHDLDANHLRFAFVGGIRYNSIFTFVKVLLDNFENHEFHFYGDFVSEKTEEKFSDLKKYKNCFFHGRFKSPDDLPRIYSQIDLLLSTYDVDCANVKYAEPNKLYESIYFRVPIIVSAGTFLAEKVSNLGAGFSVDVNNQADVVSFIKGLDENTLASRHQMLEQIPREACVSNNKVFFERISKILG